MSWGGSIPMHDRLRLIVDALVGRTMLIITGVSVLIALLMGGGLYMRALPLIESASITDLLASSAWSPMEGAFGFFPFIVGTLAVTGIAIALALPLSLLSALYISEYAHVRVRRLVSPLLDLLAAIPPVVFGVWGVLFIVPLVKDHLAPLFAAPSNGYSLLAGGIVLAIMIVPLLMSILLELFATVSREMRDASLSLGATQWQTIKLVLLRKTFPGFIAATVLAISRALGETIAVLMVCGNVASVPGSIFDSAYPLPALIANNYGEMMSIPRYDSALIFAALLLFVIICISNALSRATLAVVTRRAEG